jgi:cell cycle protein kinase DBF2
MLHKMDEIRHILVERDILAGSKGGGGWLVQLLYAFQDEESIYLAMVCFPVCSDVEVNDM